MPQINACACVQQLILILLMATPVPGLQAADDLSTAPPAGTQPKDAPATDAPDEATKKPQPKEEPPKKTAYDQLPLPKLLAKANANNPVAQFELASRFNYGRGIPRDTNEALIWLRKAAAGGQDDAARLLAVKLFNGFDVQADHVEAMHWATALAEKGDLPAQLMLASMYANGEGTPRDLVKSYKWYAIAAVAERPSQGKEPPRQDLVDSAAEQRDKIAGLLTEDEEREAQTLASDWWLSKYAAEKPIVKSKKTKKPRKTARKRGN